MEGGVSVSGDSSGLWESGALDERGSHSLGSEVVGGQPGVVNAEVNGTVGPQSGLDLWGEEPQEVTSHQREEEEEKKEWKFTRS